MTNALSLIYRHPRWLAFAVFLCSLLLALVVVSNLEQNYRLNKRADMENIAQNHAFLLRDSLRQVLTLNYSMASLVRLNKGDTSRFDDFAQDMLPNFESVSHISLSPGGVIRQVYPLAGNEKSLGFNQLEDSAQNLEARRALSSGVMTLTGPVQLVQGGTGVVARLPIFLTQGEQSEVSSEAYFWGFANVIIRIHQLLEAANIQQLKSQNIAYKLWRTNPLDGAQQVIAVNAPEFLRDPIHKSFAVPNGDWTLSVAPIHGWGGDWRLISELVLSVVLSALMGHLSLLVLKLQRRKTNLQQAVREQTKELIDARAQLQATLDAIPDLLFEVSSDGIIKNFHTHRPELLLLDPSDFLGKTFQSVLPSEAAVVIEQAMSEARDNGFSADKYYALDLPVGRRDFELSTAYTENYDKDRSQFVMISRDITDRRQAEEDLRVAATAFEAREGMMITDPKGVILRVNKAFTEVTGYSAEEVLGKTPRLLNSGHHEPAFYAGIWRTITSEGNWKGEIWNRRRSGEIYPEWLTITAVKDTSGKLTHYVSTLTDITERKESEARINNLAFFDPLTQLPNRRLLQDRLEQAVVSCLRKKNSGALLFIDLDDFKTLNDSCGHHIGDLLLSAVANRLRMAVRAQDTVGRLGGDEFLVILEELDANPDQAAAQAQQITETILDSLNQFYSLEGQDYFSTPSIGIALFGRTQVPIEELLKQADQAMYHAKAAGRNTWRFFDPVMQQLTARRFALQNEMREALQNHEFQLFYQSQWNNQGEIIGAEALIRWFHPQRGMVSPVEFIPIAEESGLILPLGHWILEQACQQLLSWSKDPQKQERVISINVSARQFQQQHFVDQLLAVVQATGANPERLKLELTESMLVHNPQDIIAKMDQLKNHGIKFSLDDFGTGYSSLAYLKRLPINELKIDKSFVNDVLSDSNDAAIARMIIRLAQSMELRVIAEGVETKEQRDWLEAEGCLHYQGYYFAKPLPIAEFEH